jgi:hypothetical protein
MSDATRQAEILQSLVVGFLSPIYSAVQPNGRTVNGYSREDFDRVMAGYACGDCNAAFATYQDVCPVCGLSREIGARPQDDPDNWNAFLEEHLNGSGKTRTRTPEEFLRDVSADPDVDQTTISSIRPGSAWRKHRKG